MFLGAGLVATTIVGAQPAAKVSRVGVLATANPRVYDVVVDELHKLGYVDGQTLVVERRSADGKPERLPELAAELVKAGVDVIVVAGGDSPLRAAKQATSSIPIVVVAIEYDPMALGYVKSLARPGGNITGVFLNQLELTAKRVEIVKTTMPKLERLDILWDASTPDQFRAAESASRTLGVRTRSIKLADPVAEVDGAFADVAKERGSAMFVVTTATFFRERERIAQAALRHRVPAVFARREFVEAGGLMSYGPDIPAMYRRSAVYVDKILKGAKPGSLPMEQPTQFELVVNSKTAKALGIAIPPSVLMRADRVIE